MIYVEWVITQSSSLAITLEVHTGCCDWNASKKVAKKGFTITEIDDNISYLTTIMIIRWAKIMFMLSPNQMILNLFPDSGGDAYGKVRKWSSSS